MNAEALSAFWSEFRESRIAVAALAIVVGDRHRRHHRCPDHAAGPL